MGLISEVLLLPFAPARGASWVIRQVVREAERQYYDPATVRAELAALEKRLEAGEIDEEEFDRTEDELLDRLEASRRSGTERAAFGGGDASRPAPGDMSGDTFREVPGDVSRGTPGDRGGSP